MKFHKARIICQRFVEEYARKIDYARVIVLLNNQGMEAVTIGSIEKYINDTAWEKGWVKPIKNQKKIKTICRYN